MNADRFEPSTSENRQRGENESSDRDELDRRVLVLVRAAKDRRLARIASEKVGARFDFVADVTELARSMASGVGAALIAGELLDDGLIELRRGRGAVVATGAGRDHGALLKAIDVVVREARALGLSPQATAALLKEAFRT